MSRRLFLRRTVCVGVAAVAMPYVTRSHFRDIVAWLRRAWPREPGPRWWRVSWRPEEAVAPITAADVEAAAAERRAHLGYQFSTAIGVQITGA